MKPVTILLHERPQLIAQAGNVKSCSPPYPPHNILTPPQKYATIFVKPNCRKSDLIYEASARERPANKTDREVLHMRRTSAAYILSVLALMLCVFGLFACAHEGRSALQYEAPLGDRDPSVPEISKLLALTDARVKKEYDLDDLSHYSVSISEHAVKPQKTVRYELYIGDYPTYESYSVTVDDNGTILNCYEANAGEYSCFLPYLSAERLRAAEEKLKGEMAEYDSGSELYLTVNADGQLCLGFEVIVKIDPPNVQVYGDEAVVNGCGIDHEHVFGSEVICDAVP